MRHPWQLSQRYSPGERQSSQSLRPSGRCCQRLAGFHETFETGEDSRPSLRTSVDALRVVHVDFVDQCQLGRILCWFELVTQTCETFRSHLWKMLIAPGEREFSRVIDLEDLTDIPQPAIWCICAPG